MRYIERRDQDDRNYYGIYDMYSFARSKPALIVHIDLLDIVLKALESSAAYANMKRVAPLFIMQELQKAHEDVVA